MERNFALVVAQSLLSSFATSVFTILILWSTISITGSPLITGIVSGLMVLPLAFNFMVGAIVDRAAHKNLMAAMATAMRSIAAMCIIVASVSTSIPVSIAFLMASALTFGVTMDILAPVRLVWSKRFLRKQVFLKGMSMMNMATRGSSLSGYLAAGLLASWSLSISATSVSLVYIISIVPILLLPGEGEGVKPGETLIHSIREGARFMWSNRTVAEAISVFVAGAFLLGMSDSAFTVDIQAVFGLGASYLSFIFVLTSLGGIAGSAWVSGMKGKVGQTISAMYGIAAGVFSIIWYFHLPLVIIAGGFFLGLSSGIRSPVIVAVILGNVPEGKMGRVQGAMDTFGFSFNSVSGFLAGAIMAASSPSDVYALIAFGLLLVILILGGMKGIQEAVV